MKDTINCNECSVPNEIHGTCCGWVNADIVVLPGEEIIPSVISAEDKELRYKRYKIKDNG